MCKAELDILDRLRAYEQLGLARAEFHAVVHTLCEDLLTPAHLSWAEVCRVDSRTLAELMAEIDQPELRLKVLRLWITQFAVWRASRCQRIHEEQGILILYQILGYWPAT